MEIINRKMVTVHQEICTFTPAIINGAVYPINKHSSKPENNNELAITVMTDQIPSISDFLWVKFTKIQHERSQTTKHLNYFSDPSKPKPGLQCLLCSTATVKMPDGFRTRPGCHTPAHFPTVTASVWIE
jgi:hypothetical protein